ncbi:unnamed protein product [Discula destructiva]
MAHTSVPPPDDTLSYIYPIGYSNSSDCGYCRNSRGGFSYYVTGFSLSPEFYQTLVDRCWRRSGSLLYRPNQKSACCPHYTLRLDSTEFKPSRDQRQAINRFNRYVLGDEYVKKAAQKYPLTREQARKRDTTFDLAQRIHEAEADKLHPGLRPAHELKVTLESDAFTEEKYAVYKNYQNVVHGESLASISERGFRRFLCDSPVRSRTTSAGGAGGHERKLGSFHQCYRLDGRLVAVGILDLLPHAVSAVYFMYHESIQKHQPGKLGALHEIALAQECGYRYWYPGYYIHSCPKMRYKIDYSPQYVLDPETLAWDLLDKEALASLDRQPYMSLSRERAKRAAENAPRTEGSSAETSCRDADGDAQISGAVDAQGMPSEEDEKKHAFQDEHEVSLFTSNMPGIPGIAELLATDLDHIRILADHSAEFLETSDTILWSDSILQLGSFKSQIAELAACLGVDMVSQIVLDFRRASRARAQ